MKEFLPFLAAAVPMGPPPAFPLRQPPEQVIESRTKIFDEEQIKEGLVSIDGRILDYYQGKKWGEDIGGNQSIFLEAKLKFLTMDWQNETLFTASIDQKVEHPKFLEIVSYGMDIVPSILSELKRNPGELVWALNFITERKISQSPIGLEQASRLWVLWGKKNKLIA